MSNKDVLETWKRISNLVADEIANNTVFANKMKEILTDDGSATTSKRRNRRPPAKIDPFTLLEQGEDKLAAALDTLSVDELKDVISANGMDTAKLALKWKEHERLKSHIIDATKRKSIRGEAFWNTQGKQQDD